MSNDRAEPTAHVNGTINEARFKMLSNSYEEEQEELRQKIATLENEIQNHEDQVESVDKFIHQRRSICIWRSRNHAVSPELIILSYWNTPSGRLF